MNIRYTFCFYLALLTAVIFPLISHAQLTIIEGSRISMTPLEFVQTYLAGPGVTISNATYNGSALPLNIIRSPSNTADQIGSFTATDSAFESLGLEGGIMLSSGQVQNASTLILPTGHASTNTGSGSDPDLTQLAGIISRDKSVLEFDFVPATDIISFRYVFGSEEFDEYCNQFNDAFGFFIRGPGIPPGPYAGFAQNIAFLPSTTLTVTINNICATDNGVMNGTYSWWNGNGPVFNYDRLTYVFTASIAVQCTQTYHLKLAVGDASDGQYDSGIFLEENSLTSTGFTGSASFSNSQTGQFLVEGCNEVTLSYEIQAPLAADLTIGLSIQPSGTATQADILPNTFPMSLTIPAGLLQTPPLTITPLADGLPEPMENLIINASTTVCNITNTVTSEFFIKDYSQLIADVDDVTVCNGLPATLTTVVSGGQPAIPSGAFHYLWNTGDTLPAITVSPGPGHHSYTVSVTDACNQAVTVAASVDVGTTPGPAGPIEGTAEICTPAGALVFSVPAITGADDYIWSLPPGAVIVNGNNTNTIAVSFGTNAASGILSVRGHSTFCGEGSESSLFLSVHPSPGPAGVIYGPASVCQGPSPVTYFIDPTGFTDSYDWSVPAGVTIVNGAGTNQISCLFTTTAVSGNFTVRGYNTACEYGMPSSLSVTVAPLPGDAGGITSANGSVVCQSQSGVAYNISPVPNAAEYLWTYSGTGAVMTINGPDLRMDFTSTATSGILAVKARNSCGDGSVSPPFNILVNPVPSVSFSSCNTLITSKNGRPVHLKGGTPQGSGGIYTGTGVMMVSPGTFAFDPANPAVTGGGSTYGIDHQVVYRYTNVHGCTGESAITISVFGTSANDPCPGIVKDHRDGKSYPTFTAGTGTAARCWMAANLDYGSFTDQSTVQTDNCSVEKYCPGNLESQCASAGGYYQWGEIMEYYETGILQDICPAGWHIPNSTEWQEMISTFTGITPPDGLAGGTLKDMNPAVGFHALLNGICYLNSTWAFTSGVTASMFWTSDMINNKPVARGLNALNPSLSVYISSKANAFPLRCVKN